MTTGNFFDDFLLGRLPKEYRFFLQDQGADPFLPYPFKEDIDGPITIGVVPQTADKFGLFPEEINQHLLIAGRSGSGKTNANRIIFYQVSSHIPCWFIDFKRDYRHLMPHAPELLVIDWRRLKVNPLRPPPGTDPVKWMLILADIFCASFALMAASKNLIVEVLKELYDLYGVSKGSDTFPSIFELHEMLEKRSRQKGLPWDEKGYITRSKNKTTICVDILGDTFDCDRGFPLEELIKKNVVFELDGLTDELQTFLVNYLLAWVFVYRMDKGERGALRQLIVFDEARKVFKKDYKSDLGTPYVDQMASQIREMGVGLVISDQIPHMLSDAAKSNCYAMLSLSLSNGKDIEDVARTMRLTKEQADALNKLEVGQGVVKLAGRYTSPFLIGIPYLKLERYVSDAEVEGLMKPVLGGYTIKPRTHLSEFAAKTHTRERPERKQKERDEFKVRVDEVRGVKKDEARDFMIHIEKKPLLSVTERYRDLSLSSSVGNRIQKELAENGYIDEVKIGKSTFLVLTDKGRETIGSPQQGSKGRGSEEHRLYQEIICRHFQGLGYKVLIERDVYGKSIDVLVSREGPPTAYEVELNLTDHIVENIVRDLAVEVKEVVIVTKRDLLGKIKEKVKKGVDETMLNKIAFMMIDAFLK